MRFSLAIQSLVTKSIVLGLLAVVFGIASSHAYDVVRIEEHWKLHVGGPDEGRSAPQVTMVMSPHGNLECKYFVFNLNYWNHPEFASGGLEVQHWEGDYCVSSHHGSNYSPLRVDGESVTWVQRLELVDSQLKFSIEDGQSVTWGNFGGQGLLKKSMPTQLSRLNDYQPNVSLTGSGIGYAGNRVSSLTLLKLKWWSAEGDEYELVAPIDIDSDIDP